jgi:hypothetical protein
LFSLRTCENKAKRILLRFEATKISNEKPAPLNQSHAEYGKIKPAVSKNREIINITWVMNAYITKE